MVVIVHLLFGCFYIRRRTNSSTVPLSSRTHTSATISFSLETAVDILISTPLAPSHLRSPTTILSLLRVEDASPVGLGVTGRTGGRTKKAFCIS